MTVDRQAIIGTLGDGLCLVAVVVVRGAHLYDEKFNENLGMFYTTALVLLGAALALVLVIFVAAHPDDTCVLACGPF